MFSWMNKYRLYYESFSPAQRLVADYFIKNPNKIGIMTLRQLSYEIKVGQHTIVRTIKDAGYSSWKEFQRVVLKEEVTSEKNMKVNQSNKKSKKGQIPLEVLQNDIEIIVKMANELNIQKLYEFVNILKKSNIIDVYGMENSSNAAAELTGKLLHLGFSCRNYSDLFLQKISAGHLENKDVAIAFSISGETKAVIEALESAKKSGAKTVAITSDNKSSLAKIADYIFITPTMYSNEVSRWISSRIGQIAFVDALCAAILNSDTNRFSKELKLSKINFENDMTPICKV
ncbi:MurR/RpiR family transcriptional regulator [Terrisporobacter mayombei]|nr:MurR/RpiR family transcriptional regulator [Terrisporobacter mayombei]